MAERLKLKNWSSVTTEKQVSTACDKLMVKYLGWSAVKFSQPRASMQTEGIPDRKYYKDDRTFWLECKREGGKQRPAQKVFQEMCERAGEVYILGGLTELTAYLKGEGILL